MPKIEEGTRTPVIPGVNDRYKLEVKTSKSGTDKPATTPINLIIDWDNIENKPTFEGGGIGEVTAKASSLFSTQNATAEVNVTKVDNISDLEFIFGIPRGKAGIIVSEVEPQDKGVVWLNPNGEGDEYATKEEINKLSTKVTNLEKTNQTMSENITLLQKNMTENNDKINQITDTTQKLEKRVANLELLFNELNNRVTALENK